VTGASENVDIPPYWKVVPPGVGAPAPGVDGSVSLIRIAPGVGYGTGTHETTQLCLLALGFLLRSGFAPRTALDFGAGSGILSIGAALSGARVEAVEIDERALDHARDNARLNGLETQIDCRTRLSQPAREFDLVFANILRSVLLEYAEDLCRRQSRRGRMILSGLVATDVPDVLARYKPLLAPMGAQVYERGEWRAIVFSPAGLADAV
jgi:ribosomal protein L11 methyltransferase